MLSECSQINSCAKKIKLQRNRQKLYCEDILKSKVPDLLNLCIKNCFEKHENKQIFVDSHQGNHNFC